MYAKIILTATTKICSLLDVLGVTLGADLEIENINKSLTSSVDGINTYIGIGLKNVTL